MPAARAAFGRQELSAGFGRIPGSGLTSTMFGTPSYPGITLFAPSGAAARAAPALIEAFTRFNIPYRSGIPPREAIPDPGTVSLFVSGKS